jgi:hypothetical protein
MRVPPPGQEAAADAARTSCGGGSSTPPSSMPINAAWHRKHPMPKNPSAEQRVAWHREHEVECACRPVPPTLRALMDEVAARPVTMLCTYRPKAGKERALLALVRKHWATLDRAGLVSAAPARVWRATDKRSGRVAFVELFQWRDEAASARAHETPAVTKLWGPMEKALERMELAVLEEVPARRPRGR